MSEIAFDEACGDQHRARVQRVMALYDCGEGESLLKRLDIADVVMTEEQIHRLNQNWNDTRRALKNALFNLCAELSK